MEEVVVGSVLSVYVVEEGLQPQYRSEGQPRQFGDRCLPGQPQ